MMLIIYIYIYIYIYNNICIINKYFIESLIIPKLSEKRKNLSSDSNVENENTTNIPIKIGLLNTNNKYLYIGLFKLK